MTTHHHEHISRRRFLTNGTAAVVAAAAATRLRLSPLGQRELAFAAVPAAAKRIYLAPDDHTDYMWTADEATYRQAFLAMLDYYLNLADATAGNATAYQSRWNCDGSFWMWEYERNKPAADFARLIAAIGSGHITVPLNPLAVVLGGTPAEAVLRGMYYPGRIERRYGLRFYEALAMEDQTLPFGLGTLWAGAGAKYSWKGICGCASQVEDAWDRQHDIYWWQGLDGSRILMKWNSLLVSNQAMGGYAEARDPAGVVEYVTGDANFRARYPYDVIGCFGKGWDDLQTLTSEFVSVAQSKTDAGRSVIVSNELDFFQDFEATYGVGLPVVSASFGNEWELYVASMAEVSARVKRATEQLRTAEALATLVSLRNAGFMGGRETARDLAFMDLGLYFEHCWTADGPVGQAPRRDWQRRLASEIEAYVNPLLADGLAALGGLIPNPTAAQRFFVFNPLSWVRSDVADIAYSGSLPVHVVEVASGQEVPSQIITVDGQQKLRILVAGVPAVGYKVYEIRAGAGATWDAAATYDVNSGVLENAIYRLTVAGRGALTSVVDKTRGSREFVRTIGGRALNDLGGSGGTLQVENAGPVSVTLLATSSATLAHTTRVTLVRDSDRIDLHNDLNQNFGSVPTWAFGFELANPDVWHEEVGAVLRAKLVTAGGHYAATNNRYDWLTLNHFADISDGTVGATLSNADCYYMRLGSSTAGALDTTTPQLTVLAGGQVDGTSLGINNQGGDTHFLQRFALRTHDAHDPAAAMRFALEHQNPFVTGPVTGGAGYPETSFSLLTISDPNILLWALKPSEEGIDHGVIARVWNMSGGAADLNLAMPAAPISSAQETTHIETPIAAATVSAGALTAALAAHQMKTFNLKLADRILIPLVAGWNLISLPWEPDDNRPEAVFASISGQYDSVYAYDMCGATPGWAKYLPGAPPFVSNLTTVGIQQGLWCHATANTVLVASGKANAHTGISLCTGWNLVGYPSSTSASLPDALTGIAGKYSVVCAYDPTDLQDPWKRYDPAVPPIVNDLVALQPSRGYWINMTEPATLDVLY